ncbi:MAG: hypothetical protein AB7E31_14055 [Desulfitobacterium sp.]
MSIKTEQPVAQHKKKAYEDEWYDLLPIEKKLIGYSLGLGISLLIVFVIIFKF